MILFTNVEILFAKSFLSAADYEEP